MGRKVKLTKDRCSKCRYAMNMTGSASNSGIIACGYILKTGESRVFKFGKRRDDYDPNYCNCYEPGERLMSLDSLTKNINFKKRRNSKND